MCVCVWVYVCGCEWLCGVPCVCGLSDLAYISEFSTTHVPLCMNSQQTISTHLKTGVDDCTNTFQPSSTLLGGQGRCV